MCVCGIVRPRCVSELECVHVSPILWSLKEGVNVKATEVVGVCGCACAIECVSLSMWVCVWVCVRACVCESEYVRVYVHACVRVSTNNTQLHAHQTQPTQTQRVSPFVEVELYLSLLQF